MAISVPCRIRIRFQPDNPNNRLVHVVGEVEGMLVCRSWAPRRQEWVYQVEHPGYFGVLIDRGEATVLPA